MVKLTRKPIIFSIFLEPSEAGSPWVYVLPVLVLGFLFIISLGVHLLSGHSWVPSYLIFLLSCSTSYLLTPHKICLFIMLTVPTAPNHKPVVLQFHEGRDFCVLSQRNCQCLAQFLARWEGSIHICGMDKSWYFLRFIAFLSVLFLPVSWISCPPLSVYSLIWWRTVFRNFLRKDACESTYF